MFIEVVNTQLRPVTYRDVCDLTHSQVMPYIPNERLLGRFVLVPLRGNPLPGLPLGGMIS